MPAAAVFNIRIDQNSDFLGTASIEEDISYCNLYSQIRESGVSPILASFHTQITDGPNGGFQFSLTAAQTLALPVTTSNYPLYYDILLVRPNGTQTRVIMGSVTVTQEITRI
jgi:hypothetical protein